MVHESRGAALPFIPSGMKSPKLLFFRKRKFQIRVTAIKNESSQTSVGRRRAVNIGEFGLPAAGLWRESSLKMLLQQLQDGGEHLLGSVQTPDEVQMLPVLDVLMVDQVRDLQEDKNQNFGF